MSIEQAIAIYDLRKELNDGELPDADVTALSALREKAERDKGCDFCLDPDGDNCDNSIYIDYTDRVAITTHDVYVPIHFCPMCGRKLEEADG